VRSIENHRKGLKDNYGRLIEYLSQMPKISYLNLLDLADFFDASLVYRFVFFDVEIWV